VTPREYRSSPCYRIWREKVLERDRYTCQDCGSVGGPLDVHHIVPFAEDVNKRFDPDNGIALCPLCHGKRHGHPDGFIRRRYKGESIKRFIIDIDESLHRKLKIYASIDNTSVRKIVHRALEEFLKEESKGYKNVYDLLYHECLGDSHPLSN